MKPEGVWKADMTETRRGTQTSLMVCIYLQLPVPLEIAWRSCLCSGLCPAIMFEHSALPTAVSPSRPISASRRRPRCAHRLREAPQRRLGWDFSHPAW